MTSHPASPPAPEPLFKKNPAQEISFASELKRKAIHLFAAVIPVGYLIVPRYPALALLATAFLISFALDVIRIKRLPLRHILEKLLGSILRHHEVNGFTGATFLLFTAFLSVLLFAKPVAIGAICFMIFGDIASALVGRRWGKTKLGYKSLEGTLAHLTTGLVVALVVPQLPFWVGAVGAVTAALVEVLPWRIDDNLIVPLVSGATMHWLL